jgi:hypothetical protein
VSDQRDGHALNSYSLFVKDGCRPSPSLKDVTMQSVTTFDMRCCQARFSAKDHIT